jgi:selenoprotein W-related protein
LADAQSALPDYMDGTICVGESGGLDQRQARDRPEPGKCRSLSLPVVEIEYCRQCRWLLRAAWTAQELLTTFDGEISGVMLKPGTGGVFNVSVDGERVWSRKDAGRHAEITELKQLVRDKVAPERSLGHSEKRRAAGEATSG